MLTVEQEIDSFVQFAKSQIEQSDQGLSIEELFDHWRLSHPPSEDALAIKASIRDMERGETGRPFGQFADEFRSRNGLSTQ